MEALVQTPTLTLEKDMCLSGEELQALEVFPTNLQCFTYYHYVLYQKGNKRIILKPLPHNLFKIIRTYDFVPA
ncbi:MAG: hypothetical protein JW801_12140 [Bacteroidales bacterium]|nr:hypothetical protein [Bacteroidales bacterium]